MTLCPGEESLLADTLRSLAVQSYPEWLLTIVSGMTAPERLSEIRNIQWLVLRDVVHLNHVIDKMTAVSPGDWLARIRPGLILEPQALQVVTDAIHAQPQWRLICCDENSHETNVSQSSTRSKPALNPDPQAHQTRRSALVLAEKEAFIAAGYHGVHGEAGNEELVRHTLNQSGDASVGHLARMLAHSPSELHDPEHATTEDRIRQHDQAGSLTLAAAWSELCAAAIRPARSTSHISANHGHFSPPADRSISFVICSIDSTKFGYITERLKSICTVPHEIIRIDDARSLSEGYTRGSAKARFDTLVLCHDDIDLLCDQALADILNHALHEFDVVGVAGPRELKTAFWLNGGPSNSVGLVIHGPAGVANAPFSINYYDSGPERHIPVQALDGVFIAAKRQVFERITFDAERFDGFHLYDIDFTYRCHLAGFKIGVCKDLLLVHSSAGNFGNDWLRYEARFHKKFPHLAAATFTPKYSPAAIHAASKAEAAAVCRNPDHFLQAGGGNERSPITTPDNQFYEIWRKRTTMQEIDAQILAERMVLNWTTRPGIHLLLALHPGEESLLADTLDSLAGQLYPEWLLTVVTPIAAPEGLADIPNLQWLALRDASHIDYVIDEMAAASPGAWLARIEPGLSFEPQSLQVIADYINTRPDWKLIYCDEDTCEADGSYTTPLFKPDFNIDLLRSMAYFGSLVLVAKQAFLDSGRYGTCAGAENYDLALRIADGYGGPQIGHISQVLAHLPRKSQRAMNPEAETAALSTHLQRNRLDADILEGALFGTRQVRYRWVDKPLVSIVIQTR
ncbi:MAG TPA: glycosyltransferase, partial [Zoogloea sp.]|nr:glycosyltransferase [Zoogloea sp.]